MKKLLFALMLAATPVAAEDFTVYGEVTGVYAITGYENYTTTERVCRNVEVTTPNGNQAGSAALGAIIGGAIGDIVSDGDGGATAGGAIIGGLIGAGEARRGSTTRIEQECDNVQVNRRRETIVNYEVDYDWNGFEGTFTTVSPNYYVGQTISLTLSLRRF